MEAEEALRWGLSTQPADRPRAEKAVLNYLKSTGYLFSSSPLPTFVWGDSPQTICCITKLVSEINESTPPKLLSLPSIDKWESRRYSREEMQAYRKEEDALKIAHDSEQKRQIDLVSTALRESLRAHIIRNNLSRRVPRLNAIRDVEEAILRVLKFNPSISLFGGTPGSYENDAELIDMALDHTQPLLGQIPVNRPGQKLKLINTFRGQFDYQFAVLKTDRIKRRLAYNFSSPAAQLSQELYESCGWVWVYDGYVFLSERPSKINYDFDAQRLHSQTQPTIEFRDGFRLYHINGVQVPPLLIEAPHKITRFRIQREPNAEVRRLMIDRYKLGDSLSGAARFMKDSNARIRDHDEKFGTLSRVHIEGDEDIQMLEVVNRSPEPDGSFKHYYLRVPPDLTTAREAAAWTFSLDPDEYDPEIET